MNSKLKYFTPREISLHNSIDDLWVTLFGKVLDLTPLIQSRTDDPRTFPLHTFGGKDISHFFNDKGQLKHHVNPDSGKIDFFLPFGSFFDIPSQQVIEDNLLEDETFQNNIANALIDRYRLQRIGYRRFPSQTTSPPMNDDIEPWWEDDKYVIGRVTLKPRWIRVCSEETLEDIQKRYLRFNKHAKSYTWKYLGQELQMTETLESNGISDLDSKCETLRLNEEQFWPTLDLYFNNDLTEF